MKTVINKKQQKQVAKLKKLVASNRAEEEKLFEGLVNSMHLKTEAEVEAMFDHIYNGVDWCVEYSKE
jgi:hypothetical protein